jgi:hypothetical protein
MRPVVRPTAGPGPCSGERPGWPGRPGYASAAGTRGSWRDDGCWAGKCACPCSRSFLLVLTQAGLVEVPLTSERHRNDAVEQREHRIPRHQCGTRSRAHAKGPSSRGRLFEGTHRADGSQIRVRAARRGAGGASPHPCTATILWRHAALVSVPPPWFWPGERGTHWLSRTAHQVQGGRRGALSWLHAQLWTILWTH